MYTCHECGRKLVAWYSGCYCHIETERNTEYSAFENEIINSSKNIEPEMQDIIDKNIWELF